MNAAEIELGAALGFAFLATSFAIESETWPVFLAYAHAKTTNVQPIGWTRENLSRLIDVLRHLMELETELLIGDEP